MAREDPQLKLRLTPEMKDHIVKAAQENNRSVNAEIVARLQISVDADRLDWNKENLQIEAVAKLEAVANDMHHQNQVMKWVLEQQSAANRLLEHIASSDGNLKPEFMETLRAALARRGTESTFPKHPDDED